MRATQSVAGGPRGHLAVQQGRDAMLDIASPSPKPPKGRCHRIGQRARAMAARRSKSGRSATIFFRYGRADAALLSGDHYATENAVASG